MSNLNNVIESSSPDQNNFNSKIKYYSNTRVFEQPLFRFNSEIDFDKSQSILYNPNGQISYKSNINTNTEYTRNKLQESNNKTVSSFDSNYFPSTTLLKDINISNSSVRSNISNPSVRPNISNPSVRPNILNTQKDYGTKINIENEFKIPEHSKKGEIPEFKSTDGRNFKLINDRRRNLDHSDYIRSGSMSNSGFGNLNNLSKIKYGESTRDIQGSLRDVEIDRFHFTYRNFQHEVYGSNPYPKDTRYLNKKF